MSNQQDHSHCSQLVAFWCQSVLKQTAATVSDKRVGVKNLKVKIKRDSQVTKKSGGFLKAWLRLFRLFNMIRSYASDLLYHT